MAIKANFTNGAPTATASGLYQWDYGQTLEIECAELGSEIMEVHFACQGMSEAIVRSCSFSNGVGTVTIPDQCLEQASTITAWVYSISGTQGHTVKTITLPITPRTRPSVSRDVPMEYINLYGEALEEINEAINNLEKGNITAAKATHANTANSANTAANAGSASYATSAGSADRATKTTYAESIITSIDMPYDSITITNGSGHTNKNFEEGIYLITYHTGKSFLSGVGFIGANVGSLFSYSFSLGRITILYDEYGSETTGAGSGAGVSLIYCGENSNPVISNSGKLKFSKIGELVHK